MLDVVINAFGFACIILLGWCTRRFGVVGPEAGVALSCIMLSVTLPCAIIVNLNGYRVAPADAYFVLLGALFNITALILAYFYGKAHGESAFAMVNLAGFNIGCFAMPFVSGLLSPHAIIQTSFFDIGNSIMCLGLNFGFASQVNGAQSSFSLHKLLSSLYHSVPVVTYAIMLALCAAGLALPNGLMHVVEIAGKANPFIAMMAIGVSISIGAQDNGFGRIARFCAIRFAHSLAAALVVALLPISLEAKEVALVLCFAPISAVNSVYTRRLGLDYSTSACINSAYVPISIMAMSAVIALFSSVL